MRAKIISIGTELTFGLTVDTNAAWLAARLAAVGVTVDQHVTVADDQTVIADSVTSIARTTDIIVITGGIGPTPDDLTRAAVAQAAGVALRFDPDSLEHIKGFFASANKPMAAGNEAQAYLPEGATVIQNTRGTAPGFAVSIGQARVFVLPGVPREMRRMYELSVEPEIRRSAAGAAVVLRAIHTFGASESDVAEQLGPMLSPGRSPGVGITAHDGIISLRVFSENSTPDSARTKADADVAEIKNRLGTLVFGEEDSTLPKAVADLLTQQGATVATAESCTGGLLAKMLTDIPGSSDYFHGGFIPYANAAKKSWLDVPADMLEREGAVSEPVAEFLAESCRKKAKSDFGLATTGIAGPGGGIAGPSGGTHEKPVGLVFVALASASATVVRRLLVPAHFGRDGIRDRSCKALLNMLRLHLLEVLD